MAKNHPSTGFADFQNLPIFTEKFAGRVNRNSAARDSKDVIDGSDVSW